MGFSMSLFKNAIIFIPFNFSLLFATDFTISSYNCGGLSDHYDYLRAVCMEKVMQERYNAEPENMALNEKIQRLALKILFSPDTKEKQLAEQEWDRNGFQRISEQLTASPIEPGSLNASWYQKAESIITSYKVRPVVINDAEVSQMVEAHLRDLTKDMESEPSQLLTEARAIMAKNIFTQHLKYDIICLQEADYLNKSMFPNHYEVLLSDSSHSKNGVAWNGERFELVETIGDIVRRAFAVKLLDKESGKTVLVASGHITGCDPYRVYQADSAKGDNEMNTIVTVFENQEADFKLIGMDSNVTSLHPRLSILKSAGYQLDYENFLESTCANPYQVLNTRIDWIAIKAESPSVASIVNIPVMSVGLNNRLTNISDHKPIAARIRY